MMISVILTIATHLALAIVLFFGVNWIGKHAVDFGYASTTLFEEVNESAALNFFLRAMSPAVFIIALSALAVALDRADWRLGIYWVVVYYYALRAVVITLLNRHRLISWPRFILHAVGGVTLALLAYHYLILPNRSLLPDVGTMGNELWLAILAFLYAVANKVPLAGGPGARRRNNFVAVHYRSARANYGHIIDETMPDERSKLVAYAVLIYEDYARPAAIRWIERLLFWRPMRTTGIMQVSAATPLSDLESVTRGTQLLREAWEANSSQEYPYYRVTKTIGRYNADDDYIQRVVEVMELLAKRVEPTFRSAYDGLWQPLESSPTA